MRFDSIIFDIDGTLWDATRASARGWNKATKSLGIKKKVTDKDVKKVAGAPFEICVEYTYPGLQKNHPTLLDTVSACELNVIKKEGGDCYVGVKTGIEALAKKYDIYLVSNCQDWYLSTFLEHCDIVQYISGMDCNGLSGLPKDQMLIRMKEKYDLQHPVYVGDTAGDELSAKNAGIDFMYVSYGFGDAEQYVAKFNSFEKLTTYFLNL
ncbi:HAD family hydrolase [Patescibacteria group bacterium]|nr:HAD family hydrolase [Patescibacteria group bacterium]MBU1722208.1 HAD family hydrolase [Patescibacteria group bacterium]MBU1901159.1 HAD family hydrolase [Patescibacteria group bacterium]